MAICTSWDSQFRVLPAADSSRACHAKHPKLGLANLGRFDTGRARDELSRSMLYSFQSSYQSYYSFSCTPV